MEIAFFQQTFMDKFSAPLSTTNPVDPVDQFIRPKWVKLVQYNLSSYSDVGWKRMHVQRKILDTLGQVTVLLHSNQNNNPPSNEKR